MKKEKLQRTIGRIKVDREMGERYMTLEELLREREQKSMLTAKQEFILKQKEAGANGYIVAATRKTGGSGRWLKALATRQRLKAL